MALRFLIVDGYTPEARESLRAAGMSLGFTLYARMLGRWLPDAEYTCWCPSESATPPYGRGPEHYSAVLWTGSNLNIYEREKPLVTLQLDFAARTFEAGTPAFGSCWGLQVAAAAAGGEVSRNPRGREIGIARKIQLTAEGREHPMLQGRADVFDNFGSHLDEVSRLPAGAVVLAGNESTRVQAIEINHAKGSFWGVQYHPEYDLHEMARLITARSGRLREEGFFRDPDDLGQYVGRLEALHEEPDRKDLRWQLDIGEDLVSPDIRQLEFRNWLTHVVQPRAAGARHVR
jgi:GMP synthase (glutamine-hydrolysing)